MKKRKTQWEVSAEFAERFWPDSYTSMPQSPKDMRNSVLGVHYTGVMLERRRQRRAAAKKRRKP